MIGMAIWLVMRNVYNHHHNWIELEDGRAEPSMHASTCLHIVASAWPLSIVFLFLGEILNSTMGEITAPPALRQRRSERYRPNVELTHMSDFVQGIPEEVHTARLSMQESSIQMLPIQSQPLETTADQVSERSASYHSAHSRESEEEEEEEEEGAKGKTPAVPSAPAVSEDKKRGRRTEKGSGSSFAHGASTCCSLPDHSGEFRRPRRID